MNSYFWCWSAKTHQRWAATRAQGKRKFILVKGVLAWGLPMFASHDMPLLPSFTGLDAGSTPSRMRVQSCTSAICWSVKALPWRFSPESPHCCSSVD